ncbi:Shikimate kinase [Gracilariopsis chorda]|uniref:Shikimate kinase n=1 Tax=Gracilariopsis chorda TaxID=448386 RepID=A0A2V3IPT7_9FLOR|nr:Shikimate kinase [Gracilariopsis chorda]|eukprot:PXF44101.1 Shikimate kinase [Gracilariopsis chorda]
MEKPAFVCSIPRGRPWTPSLNCHKCNGFYGKHIVLPTKLKKRALLFMCESSTDSSQEQEAAQPRYTKEVSLEVKELKSVLKKCSIYLIGPMGSGKSVIGKYMASELGFCFLDTDELIEAAAKRSIPEIFETDGEEAFRDLESAVLDQLAAFIGCCVATGGGAVLRKSNWGKLRCGIVVYLETPVDVLRDRLQGDTTRPLLKNADGETLRERIRDILEERRHLYMQADLTVHIEKSMPVDDAGKEVIRKLTNFIKANPPRSSKLYPGNLPKRGA